MQLRFVILFLLLFVSTGLNYRLKARYYQFKGKAYSKNHEPIRNGKLFVNQRGKESETPTDSLGNYSFHVLDYPAMRVKNQQNSRHIQIRYETKTISIRNNSKKYHRKQISVIENDLYFR